MIKTDDVPGKPEWSDQLVNKVIVEGDDVTVHLQQRDNLFTKNTEMVPWFELQKTWTMVP